MLWRVRSGRGFGVLAARATVDVYSLVLVLHLVLLDVGRDVDAQAPERASNALRIPEEVHRLLSCLDDCIDAKLALSDTSPRGEVHERLVPVRATRGFLTGERSVARTRELRPGSGRIEAASSLELPGVGAGLRLYRCLPCQEFPGKDLQALSPVCNQRFPAVYLPTPLNQFADLGADTRLARLLSRTDKRAVIQA